GAAELVCVWNVQGGAPRVLRGHTAPITALNFSADGRTLFTASEDGKVGFGNLAAVAAGEIPATFVNPVPGQKLPITAAEMNAANPRWIVTAHWSPGRFGQIVLWDAQAAPRPRPLPLGEVIGRPHGVVFSPDGRFVGAAGQDKVLHLWALQDGKP